MPPTTPQKPPVFRRRNHRLPSCPLSLFFQTPKRIHLPFQHVSHYWNLSEQRCPNSVSPSVLGKTFFFIIIIFIYRSNPSYVLDFSLTDSVGFAAGSQSAAVGDPLLEQPEPRRPAQPCPAAGPRLPLPGKSCGACGCGADKRKIKGAKSSRREQQKVQHRE